jgi:hypothetical protein
VSREGLLPLILQYLATIPPADSPKPKARRDITPLPFTPISGAVVEDVKVGGALAAFVPTAMCAKEVQ